MPPTKWRPPKAVIQKFAIVTHSHPLPVCTERKHSPGCKGKGIFLGCRQTGRIIHNPGKTPTAIYWAECTHLRK